MNISERQDAIGIYWINNVIDALGMGKNMAMTLEEIQEELRKRLKKKRYQHTLGVYYTAQAMAMCFGEDISLAGYGGMLHDCAKYLSGEEMLAACKKNRISISETERVNPGLLHAKLGAHFARECYGVEEEGVLSAIRWHTTGKPGMNELEKILFIADYIEPGRRMLPRMEEIRREAFHDLDEAMYLILFNTLSYLKVSGEGEETLDQYTVDAFDFYRELRERKQP